MALVTLSLGSNMNAQENLTSCLDALLLQFQDLSLSSVFESEAVGFEGDNFLNMAVALETDLPLAELSGVLKSIEDKHGRDRSQPKFSGRSLDIDILTYSSKVGTFDGIVLPREEIIRNAFVLWPLSQIMPAMKHPGSNNTYTSMWQEFDKQSQKLWPVNFTWHGRKISEQ